MAFHRILVPTDFSEAAKNALLLAKDMARQGDATLTLMHVGDLPYIPTSGLTADHSQQSRFLVDLAEEMSAHQHKQLEELAGENLSDTDKVRLLVRRGYAPEEILDQIKEGKHDLVVLGTHGRTGVKRVLLGSVAERVLRTADVPVLVTH